MNNIKRRLGLLLLASTFILGACSGSDENVGSDVEATNGEPQVLVVANGADPVTFDIQATNDQATTRVARQIYDTLITQTNDLELVPGLATEWEEVEENLYEFKLREDVVFHNGEPFTANDVAYTLNRAVESPTIGHIVGSIDPATIEVVDDHTIRVGTSDTFGPFLTHLAHPAVGILNEKAVEEAGEDYGITVAVGTGPFKFVEWVAGTHVLVLADRNEDYWGDAPEVDSIEFKTIADPSVRLIELESGTVDIAYDIAPSDIPAVTDNSELTLINTPNLGAEYLGLNVKNDTPLQDIKVRQAIAHAIDVESIIKTVYMDVGSHMAGPINELVFGYNEDLEPTAYDVDKAKALLAEAGYEEGDITLSLYVGDNSQERIRVSQVVSEALSKVGITVEVSQMEWGAFLDAAAVGEPDMFLLGWTTVTTDADYGLYPLFHSDSFGEAGNRTFYKNDRVDELLELGRYTSDQEQRLEYYYEAQEIISEEVPWVFLQTRENVTGVRNWVKGFEHHPTGSYFLEDVSLDKE
ncbi:ABC transporter substrate-binding protein [Jeotgalibaca caeni]|uniref:ABC transporter substrate-binding protein n=1 Tax=Jeotgalibaca caeni TaxID=3028623 RepID=UPI00237E4595|nr:ABC transporter substrate-binding protein [Jeotgalibaca caeni]MDE1549275.1 ABC transporter substrate-binding protein [Jeotgalibaca caeni]